MVQTTSPDVTTERMKVMADPFEWQEGTVLLPVPLKHAQEVARFAAALAAGQVELSESVGSEEPIDPTVTVEGQGPWSQDMVARLADSVTYGAVLALLDECANRPGQWVAKAEVEEAGGISAIQLRNELGALSKKTRKLFGTVTWPMEWRKVRGTYSYRMDGVVAGWWTQARKDAHR